LATIAPALFIKETLRPDTAAQFKPETTKEQRNLFNLCVDKTRLLSDGVWFGTAFNLAKEREKGTLALQAPQIKQTHLVLWGEDDIIIPIADMKDMTRLLPNCQLRIIKNVGRHEY
jgi:pimeloyl-ACP methyl ester carboxylesterase